MLKRQSNTQEPMDTYYSTHTKIFKVGILIDFEGSDVDENMSRE